MIKLLTIFSKLFGDLKDENFEVNRWTDLKTEWEYIKMMNGFRRGTQDDG